MVDKPSGALSGQLTGLTVETQSYSTVRHLHIKPNCGIIAFVNSTCKSILDVIFGQLRNIHGAVSSLKGRQKLSFFDPGTGWGMARLCDRWRCAGRGSVKRYLYGAVEIEEEYQDDTGCMDMLDIYLTNGLRGIVAVGRSGRAENR